MIKKNVVEVVEITDFINKVSNSNYYKRIKFCGITIYSYSHIIKQRVPDKTDNKIGFSKNV